MADNNSASEGLKVLLRWSEYAGFKAMVPELKSLL
jgi:hypothetical protein